MASYSDSGVSGNSSPFSTLAGPNSDSSDASLRINVSSSLQVARQSVSKVDKGTSTTVKVDKDDIRAKRHILKTEFKNGKECRSWECGLCGKEFKYQYTLIRHIPTHTDVRNFHCDICSKSFRQMSTLAQHKATHWDIRPFSCDVCNKSFNRVSTLISHKKIHSDEKKHVCSYCGKGFHQKGNLKNHMYTHTNERPYKCDFCDKGFNQKSNLVVHKKSAHFKKSKYICVECNITFEKSYIYAYHMECVHDVKVPETSTPNSSARVLPQCITKEGGENSYNQMETISDQAPLAYIRKKPTFNMLILFSRNEVPFVLYCKAGEKVPTICKVVLCGDHYFLVNPNLKDLQQYSNNSNNSDIEIPIVNFIQEEIVNGMMEVTVKPFVKEQIGEVLVQSLVKGKIQAAQPSQSLFKGEIQAAQPVQPLTIKCEIPEVQPVQAFKGDIQELQPVFDEKEESIKQIKFEKRCPKKENVLEVKFESGPSSESHVLTKFLQVNSSPQQTSQLLHEQIKTEDDEPLWLFEGDFDPNTLQENLLSDVNWLEVLSELQDSSA